MTKAKSLRGGVFAHFFDTLCERKGFLLCIRKVVECNLFLAWRENGRFSTRAVSEMGSPAVGEVFSREEKRVLKVISD